ncbi:MAG: hypothetical protein AB8G26_17140 [Ilumatobacter sp.]
MGDTVATMRLLVKANGMPENQGGGDGGGGESLRRCEAGSTSRGGAFVSWTLTSVVRRG